MKDEKSGFGITINRFNGKSLKQEINDFFGSLVVKLIYPRSYISKKIFKKSKNYRFY